MDERLAGKHIVLLGIGHTNAHIVRMWGMNPIPDADLTCIGRFFHDLERNVPLRLLQRHVQPQPVTPS